MEEQSAVHNVALNIISPSPRWVSDFFNSTRRPSVQSVSHIVSPAPSGAADVKCKCQNNICSVRVPEEHLFCDQMILYLLWYHANDKLKKIMLIVGGVVVVVIGYIP